MLKNLLQVILHVVFRDRDNFSKAFAGAQVHISRITSGEDHLVMPEPEEPLAPQYLADQLTLFQPGKGRLCPTITTGTPNVFHLPASL